MISDRFSAEVIWRSCFPICVSHSDATTNMLCATSDAWVKVQGSSGCALRPDQYPHREACILHQVVRCGVMFAGGHLEELFPDLRVPLGCHHEYALRHEHPTMVRLVPLYSTISRLFPFYHIQTCFFSTFYLSA